jgi:hypothetical protein
MVTTRLGIAAICAVFMTAGNWARQNQTVPILTTSDIVAIVGSDVDARNVIARVLTHAMANPHAMGSRRWEFFLASQIRNEWLPVAEGVDFVRLADTEIAGFLAGCGSYWVIGHLERVEKVVSIRLSKKCGGTALDYIVSFDGSEWRLGPPGAGKDRGWVPGIGSGIAGPRPECPCLKR